AAAVGWWSWLWAVVSVVGITAAMGLAYTLSRFRLLPRPLRWLGSAVASVPFVAAYFAGRTWGIVRLFTRRPRSA
ncbi:MAG TPA: hypothetical protein VEJ87_12245, partial [Acidimicrobiales bacterium]|nr:hypothetical protein [Acidimicrobiales bacterium]